MNLKSGYKMSRRDWLTLVESHGGTTYGSRHQTSENLKTRGLPFAIKDGKPRKEGGFAFKGGKLVRTSGRGR